MADMTTMTTEATRKKAPGGKLRQNRLQSSNDPSDESRVMTGRNGTAIPPWQFRHGKSRPVNL